MRDPALGVYLGDAEKGKTMELETIKAKLRKIAALAERGVGGERTNAKHLLETLLEKHHLQLDDVVGNPSEREQAMCWFKCTTKLEREILFGCYCRTLNKSEISYYRGKRQIGFKLTRLDALEMRSLWDHFRPLFKKELKAQHERIAMAFVWKHELQTSGPSEGGESKPLSRAELNALISLMQGMAPTRYVSTRRQLAGE